MEEEEEGLRADKQSRQKSNDDQTQSQPSIDVLLYFLC